MLIGSFHNVGYGTVNIIESFLHPLFHEIIALSGFIDLGVLGLNQPMHDQTYSLLFVIGHVVV